MKTTPILPVLHHTPGDSMTKPCWSCQQPRKAVLQETELRVEPIAAPRTTRGVKGEAWVCTVCKAELSVPAATYTAIVEAQTGAVPTTEPKTERVVPQ
jgi:hypothetical protein